MLNNLGHHKYSQFIQDCFYDLNEVVLDYNAEIYQYVGDEAVLSWPYQKGLANNNCVGVFFAFEAQRKSRKDYYLEKYEVFPEFKAGLHGGSLMVAEVGFVKKELAYHGDVINTSARIQAECNKHNVTLLLSEKLLRDLKIDILSKTKSLGNVILKGKQKEVNISYYKCFMIKTLYKNRFEIFLTVQLTLLFGSLLFPHDFFEYVLTPILYLLNILAGILMISKQKKAMWFCIVLFLIALIFFWK